MSEAWVWLVAAVLGVLAAYVERRDVMRLAEHLVRLEAELGATRERLALLEERTKNPWKWGK